MEDFFIPLVFILFITLWLWAILDLVFSTFKKTRWKLAWLLAIIFFPFVGSILYLLLKKDFKAGPRKFRRHFDGQGKIISREERY